MKRILILAFALAAGSVFADEVRLVIKGHDPVAYFTEGKAVKGDPKYSLDWDEGRYHFANARHRDMFAANPEKYAPQFGGYCTGSMSANKVNEADPDAFVIKDGKLYVFGDVKWKPIAENDPEYLPSRIPKAANNWQDKKRRS